MAAGKLQESGRSPRWQERQRQDLIRELEAVKEQASIAKEACADMTARLHAHDTALRGWRTDAEQLLEIVDAVNLVLGGKYPRNVEGHRLLVRDLKSRIEEAERAAKPAPTGRQKLPDVRRSVTKLMRFRSAKDGEPGRVYVTVGFDDAGAAREVFIRADKVGSFVSGILDGLAISVSLGLQYGVPVDVIVSKFEHQQFEPRGITGDPAFPMVSSVLDYLGRWLRTARPSEV